MTTRWEQWRGDSVDQQLRNVSRDLDENDRYHRDEETWRKHIDEEIEGVKKLMFGFIVSSAGIIVVAALNVAVLIAKG